MASYATVSSKRISASGPGGLHRFDERQADERVVRIGRRRCLTRLGGRRADGWNRSSTKGLFRFACDDQHSTQSSAKFLGLLRRESRADHKSRLIGATHDRDAQKQTRDGGPATGQGAAAGGDSRRARIEIAMPTIGITISSGRAETQGRRQAEQQADERQHAERAISVVCSGSSA